MDVTCERCGTEYEFDETLVSDRGTTVKCTQCGHLFKVFRPGGAPEGAPDSLWRIRRLDGSVETVPTLRDLQRRIIQGALSPDDEISASGQPWKRLGAIAELESFFAPAVGARVPSSAPGARSDATVPFEVQRPASDPAPARRASSAPPPPPSRREKRTLMGVGMGMAALSDAGATSLDPPRVSSPPGAASRPPSHPAPRERPESEPSAGDSQRPDARPVSSFPPRERRSAVEHEAPVGLRISQADAVPVRRRGGAGIFVAVGLVAVLAAVVWQRDRIVEAFGGAEDPVAPFLALGNEALAGDSAESYQAAVFELTRATGVAPRDARALSLLARAHALWAQALAFEALDHEGHAGSDPASAGEARRARSEMRRHVDAARRFAEDAVRADPSLALASLAFADSLRLAGDLAAAEQHLERAQSGADVPAEELHRVAALLAVSRADGDFSHAVDEARRAVEAAPGVVRNRVLLARALLASGDARGARRQLAEAGPEHEMVRPLLAAIDAGAASPASDEAATEPPEPAPLEASSGPQTREDRRRPAEPDRRRSSPRSAGRPAPARPPEPRATPAAAPAAEAAPSPASPPTESASPAASPERSPGAAAATPSAGAAPGATPPAEPSAPAPAPAPEPPPPAQATAPAAEAPAP